MNRHFDWAASLYDRLIHPDDPARLRKVLQLPVDGWMLDAGGGTGRASAALRPLVGRLVVSDLSRPMLEQAQAKPGLWPVQTRVERLPFPDGCFERVVVVDALHHFDRQREAIADLLRVLAPGGRLVIQEPNLHRWPTRLTALIEKLALMQSHFHTPQAMQAMVAACGLPARVESDGQNTVWVVVDK